MSEISERLRAEFGSGDAQRDAGLTTPANIRRYDGIRYGEDMEWNVLDVYRPRYAFGKRLPVILIVHGGAWVYGTKEVYQFYGMELASKGFAVVNYTYRLAPEHPFPASLEDSVRVCRWILSQADTYLFDTDRIFAAGDSAGGHLLGLLCAFLCRPDYAARFRFSAPEGFRLRGIGMNCGIYDPFAKGAGSDALDREALMADLLGEKKDDPAARSLTDVLSWVSAAFPPMMIVSAKGDYLLPQASLLEDACRKAGVRYVTRIYGDADTPLYHVFHCNLREPAGRVCNDEECAFFRKLGNEGAERSSLEY